MSAAEFRKEYKCAVKEKRLRGTSLHECIRKGNIVAYNAGSESR